MKKETQGRITDIELYEFICKNEGMNMFEIARELKWSTGKVQLSVRRLEERNIIESEVVFNSSKPKRIIKPKKWFEKADKNDLEIFKNIVSRL